MYWTSDVQFTRSQYCTGTTSSTHPQQLEHGGDDRGLSARGAQDADDRNDVFIIHVQVAVPLLSHGMSSEELSVLKVV